MPKPMGAIPAGYGTGNGTGTGSGNGELMIGGQTASALAQRCADTPAFVYSRDIIARKMKDLRAAMPARLAIHYAMKANPHPELIEFMAPLVDGFDVASGGEMARALAARIGVGVGATRVNPEMISFAGPGKRDSELEAAITAGVTINLESESEFDRAVAIAARLSVTPQLAVRINPSFDLKGSGMKMGGGAKPFGVDAARVPALVRRILASGANWRGFHIYAGSQALSAEAITAMQRETLSLVGTLADDIGTGPAHVNLGGGFGIPYFAGDAPLDIHAVGAALDAALDALPPMLAQAQFSIELGRYLVGEAGVYLTRIIDRKISNGETFLITDGGLHHLLAASGNFGTVIRRNYPVAIASRFDAQPSETVHIVGCLCTPLDIISNQVRLPRAEIGDLVAVFCTGAYGATASPTQFLGQGAAHEILV